MSESADEGREEESGSAGREKIKMNLSGFTVIKNGVTLGYPFIESILSLLPVCDEFVISEGFSDDDTFHHLRRLQKKHPDKIKLRRDRWPDGLTGGSAIGKMQTKTFKRCRSRWAYLLQADELMPQENLPTLRNLCTPRTPVERLIGRRRFNSYQVDFLHLREDLQTTEPNAAYRWAVRLVRRRPLIVSDGDGWQMRGPGCSLIGVAAFPKPVWHLGYAFPVNVWRKQINHARLYPEVEIYQSRARKAAVNLDAWERGELPPPGLTTNPLDLPPSVAPLIGRVEYAVREELF